MVVADKLVDIMVVALVVEEYDLMIQLVDLVDHHHQENPIIQ